MNALMKAIVDSRSVREAQSEDLKTALVFAKLELLEVQAGIRGLTQCPGLDQLAKMIKEAKGE